MEPVGLPVGQAVAVEEGVVVQAAVAVPEAVVAGGVARDGILKSGGGDDDAVGAGACSRSASVSLRIWTSGLVLRIPPSGCSLEKGAPERKNSTYNRSYVV